MNWRAYFKLVRPGWLLLFNVSLGYVLVFLTAAILAARQAVSIRHCLGAALASHLSPYPPQNWAGLRAFGCLALFVPAWLGVSLAIIVQAALWWRFMPMLPGARRMLRRCHAVIVGVTAVICALIGHRLDPGTPLPAFLGLATAALSLAIAISASGAREAFVAILGLLMVTAWFTPEIRMLAQSFPLTVGGAGIVTAIACFHRGFSREQLRANAASDWAPVFVDVLIGFSGAARAAEARQQARVDRGYGRAWRHGPVGDSLVAWLRVMLYERYGRFSRLRIALYVPYFAAMVIAAPLCMALIALTLVPLPGPSLGSAAKIFYLICEPAKLDFAGGFSMVGIFAAIAFLVGTVEIALPRASHLYVISRAKRARVAFFSALLRTAALLGAISGILLGVAWSAAWFARLPFSFSGPPGFLPALCGTLPLVPLCQWHEFAEQTRHPLLWKSVTLTSIIVGWALAGAVSIWPAAIFSPVRLPLFLLSVAASHGAFYAALQRLYRQADLIGAEARLA
jgi:hypothetical protein